MSVRALRGRGLMATDLQLMYANERMRGAGHHAALRAVAERTGIDKGSVDRALKRARQADERDSRTKRRSA